MSIKIDIDRDMYNKIINSMRDVKKSEESVLKTAVNNTAKKAQKLLAKQANKVYAGEAPKGILERSSIKKASVASPAVIISFRSEQPDITKFKVSASGKNPNPTTFVNKVRMKFPIYAQPLRGGGMKPLIGTSGSMAFCVKFRNGKVAIVFRKKGKKRGYESKTVLKTVMGSSDKVMVQNKKVYGAVQEKISDILYEQCERVLEKALRGK